MLLKFNVNQQKLSISDKVFLADKSHNIIQCKFSFKGSDWENKQIFVLLRDFECKCYQLHLPEDNIISIPTDVLINEKFTISLYGEDNDENRITTNMVNFRLNPSGYTTDIEDLQEVTVDIWTQIFEGIDGKSDLDHKHTVSDITDFPVLSEVALSNDYNDLSNKPNIPTKTSQLVNDSGFLTQHQSLTDYIMKSNVNGLVRNDGSIDATQYLTEHQDISMKADKSYVDNLIGTIEEDMLL